MAMARARDENLYMAKLASAAEVFEDAASFMEKLLAAVVPGEELTTEEINLLRAAFNKATKARFESLKSLSSVEFWEEEKGDAERVALVLDYRAKIEAEIVDISTGPSRLLDDRLIATVSGIESKVKLLTMKAHCHQNLAKFTTGDEKMDAVEKALTAYKAAKIIADEHLPPTKSLRLGLAHDFSVFCRFVLESPEESTAIAQQAYDEATAKLDASIEKELDEDSTLFLETLYGNLMMWTAGQDEDEIKAAPKKGD